MDFKTVETGTNRNCRQLQRQVDHALLTFGKVVWWLRQRDRLSHQWRNVRNPCWSNKHDSDLVCLPKVIVFNF